MINKTILFPFSKPVRPLSQTPVKKQSGMTLEELIIVVGVIATLSALVPSMLYAMARSNHVSTTVNRLSHDLRLARNEAVRNNEQYVICKSRDGKSCARNKNGWEQGWLVYADINKNRTHEPGEYVVRYQPAFDNNVKIQYRAFGSRHYVTYKASGWTMTNGTFHVCGEAKGRFAKAIVLYKTGRVRISDKKGRKKPDCRYYADKSWRK